MQQRTVARKYSKFAAYYGGFGQTDCFENH